MGSAFNPKTFQWEINWPERISRYDVVYLTPPDNPKHGMAVGNGDLGALVWFESTRIVLVVNKCDLWDDAKFDRFSNWDSAQEEYSTTLRHGGRIIIDFHQPVFDVIYLGDCRGGISLADARVKLAVSGPLGRVSFSAFVCHDENTLCCSIESELPEDVPLDITTERFGSRMFHHWYCTVRTKPELGLPGTGAEVKDDAMFITHQLTSGRFALGSRVLPEQDVTATYIKESSHRCTCRLAGNAAKTFTLLATITSPADSNPVPQAWEHLETARATGPARLFESHVAAWRAFWNRSLLDTGRPFIDQYWHLNMYYANSAQGGEFPGRFIDGLWFHNHDYQAWGFYFHWNQQQIYWPLNAAGHHDLVEAYLNWRFKGLPHAQRDARELFNAPEGAVAISDVSERRGYNSELELGNHTPGAQIALEFWRQYRYTGDEEFLREKGLPYLIGATLFFEKLFVQDENGVYHAAKGTGYEGGVMLRDCVTELACAKALLAATLQALQITGTDHPHSAKWREVLDHMAPFMVVPADPRAIDPETLVLKRGCFKGDKARSNAMFAAGYGLEQQKVLTSLIPYDEPAEYQVGEELAVPDIWHRPLYRINAFVRKLAGGLNPFIPDVPEMGCHAAIFPYVEYAAVFPTNVLGLADRNTDLYHAAVNTVKLYANTMLTWDPMPILLARLGLSRELSAVLDDLPDFALIYPNGMVSDGPAMNTGPDAPLALQTFGVWDKEQEGRKFRWPALPFRTFAFEAPGVLACALNESLLQSHDGVIRVAPATDATLPARFTLHATGGFVVSSEIRDGRPLWIAVESRRGGECRVANPWPKAFAGRDGKLIASFDHEIMAFNTQPGNRFLIVPDKNLLSAWQTEPLHYTRNEEPRASKRGISLLGLPRMF